MGSPNPFDFSDFGPPSGPAGAGAGQPGPHGVGPAGPGPVGPGAGFDPWGGQGGPAPAGGDPAGTLGAAPGSGFGGAADGRDAFGQLGAPAAGPLTTAGPPTVWFAVALGVAVLGIVAAIGSALGGGIIWLAAAGWLLAGPVAIGALAVYNRVDTRRRTDAIYSAPSWVGTVYWVVLATCLLGIALGAWQIALWAGKL